MNGNIEVTHCKCAPARVSGNGNDNPDTGKFINIYPNPANVWTAFDYELFSSDCTGTISIVDLNGNQMAIFNISGKQGQQLWDTRNVIPGVYIYTISSLGSSKSGKLIIK